MKLPAVLASAIAGGVLLRRMRQEFLNGGLTAPTAAAMYAAYALHATSVVRATRRAAGSIPLPRRAAVVTGGLASAAGIGLLAGAMTKFASPAHVSAMDDETLVTDGVYRISRHPQYVGYVFLLTGISMGSRSLPAAALTVGYAAVIAWWAPLEERALEGRFGDDYVEYRRTTSRWLGTTT